VSTRGQVLKSRGTDAEGAIMASIEERGDSWLVRWRVNGKRISRSFRWGQEVQEDFDSGNVITITKERARASAEAFAAQARTEERAYRRPLEKMQRELAARDPSFRPIFGSSGDQDYIGEDEDGQRFQNYVLRLIQNDAISESARETYGHTLRNHIEGTPLGLKNIRFIDPEDIENFWFALRCGDGAKRNIAQVLAKGFSRAVKRGLIESNPMRRADIQVPSKRKRVRGAIRVLELDELKRLAASAGSERDRLIVMVMGFAGLRAGEVGGLTQRDIVRRDGYCELHVHQQAVLVGHVKKLTQTKTEAAVRQVPVPCQLADQLEAFLTDNPPPADGRVFQGRHGDLLTAQNINNAIQRAARRAQLGPVNSHLLRHTAASLWFDDGLDPESVRAALGHSNIQTTLGLYAHLLKGGRAKLAESMGRRMGGDAA
jgi:integrase